MQKVKFAYVLRYIYLYKVCSITLPKFNTSGSFIPILGTSAIMDQTPCCYNVTTSETGLFNTYSMKQPDLYYFETIKMTSQA